MFLLGISTLVCVCDRLALRVRVRELLRGSGCTRVGCFSSCQLFVFSGKSALSVSKMVKVRGLGEGER